MLGVGAFGSDDEVFSAICMVCDGVDVEDAAESAGGGYRLKKWRSRGGSDCASLTWCAIAASLTCWLLIV